MTPQRNVPGRPRFEGLVAVVTGAGAGLGAATARRLSEEGADLIVVDIDAERSEATAAELQNAGGKAVAVQADVGEPVGVQQIREVTSSLGGADILVNNAARASDGELVELSPQVIVQDITVTLTGSVLCTRPSCRI